MIYDNALEILFNIFYFFIQLSSYFTNYLHVFHNYNIFYFIIKQSNKRKRLIFDDDEEMAEKQLEPKSTLQVNIIIIGILRSLLIIIKHLYSLIILGLNV